jgi:hypothetical protein
MAHRHSVVLSALMALVLPGCDALCAYGIGDAACAPCDPVSVSEAWEDPMLQPLVPGDDAFICEAQGDELGKAKLSYWVPTKVHDTNMTVVGTAQEAGWSRLDDNWYDTDDTSQMAKWSKLGLARGDTMRIDIKAERKGSRVEIDVEGVPPPPSLRGDVTIFAYRQATFALFDGRISLLPEVSAGVSIPLADGFLFRSALDQFGQYRADGTVVDYAPFPVATEGGFLSAHGRGPRGRPWMSHNPRGTGRPLLLGELVGEAWDIEMVPDIDPALPYRTVDAAHSGDGTVWLLGGSVLYAKDESGWHGTKIKGQTGALRPLAAEGDGVLISTEHAVLRATLEEGKFKLAPAAKLEFYPELYDAGPLGVAARTADAVVLIRGEEVTETGLPGESEAPDLATNAQGVIAVATKSPSTLLVRDASGAITRYPAQGELDGRVFSLSIDPMGRVWTLMVGSNPVVADNGKLVPLDGLVGDGLRPSSITFIGNGAPPFLDAKPENYALATQ